MMKSFVKNLMVILSFVFSLSPVVGFANVKTHSGGELMTRSGVPVSISELSEKYGEPIVVGEISPDKEVGFAEYIFVSNEAEANKLIQDLPKKELSQLRNNMSQFAENYKNGDYCVPAGVVTMAIGAGLAFTWVLMPIALALIILAVPVSVIDLATGCDQIMEF